MFNYEPFCQTSNQIAEAIVRSFNWQLRDELKICSPLKLKKIEYAKKLVLLNLFYKIKKYISCRLIPKQELLKFKASKDMDGYIPDLTGNTKPSLAHFQVKLETTPGRFVCCKLRFV